jgi:hypothetical protein
MWKDLDTEKRGAAAGGFVAESMGLEWRYWGGWRYWGEWEELGEWKMFTVLLAAAYVLDVLEVDLVSSLKEVRE